MRQHASGQIFHVLNRGVDKRPIFMDDNDRYRFIHDLYEFNDTASINNQTYFFLRNSKVIARPYITERKPRKLLVQILAFCLMPNHYHLLLKPNFDNGITRFMKRLNMGYARYFNERYERSGALFQGRYKSVLIETDAHFLHLPYYIHSNPLDLKHHEWRTGKISNLKQAQQFLNNYRWSSHLDYLGRKNFPSVTQREFLLEFFGGVKEYQDRMKEWLNEQSINLLEGYTLE